jgi:hypothetical protein
MALGNLAFFGWFFKYIENKKGRDVSKIAFCLIFSVGYSIAGISLGWTESIFMAS